MTRLAEIGQELKEARLARNRTLEDVANETRLKVGHLAALEEGDESRLPEPVYVKGFIRKYAQAVGMPAEELANRYWATRPLPPIPEQRREFNMPWWIYPWILLIVLVAIIGALYAATRHHAETPEATPTPTATVTPRPKIAPAATGSVGARPATGSLVATGSHPAIATGSHVATASVAHPATASAAVHPTPKPGAKPSPKPSAKPRPKPTAKPKPAAVPGATQSAPATTSAAPSGNHVSGATVLSLHANRLSWVRVTRDGHEVYEDTMRPGQTVSWPLHQGLTVTIGNGAGVEVKLGDHSLGALGGEGEVVKRFFKGS